jgi:hypothetical protein
MQRVDANGRLFIRVDAEPWALFAMNLQSGTRDIGVRFDSKTNGTGALRQFVSKATRLSSRVAFSGEPVDVMNVSPAYVTSSHADTLRLRRDQAFRAV